MKLEPSLCNGSFIHRYYHEKDQISMHFVGDWNVGGFEIPSYDVSNIGSTRNVIVGIGSRYCFASLIIFDKHMKIFLLAFINWDYQQCILHKEENSLRVFEVCKIFKAFLGEALLLRDFI